MRGLAACVHANGLHIASSHQRVRVQHSCLCGVPAAGGVRLFAWQLVVPVRPAQCCLDASKPGDGAWMHCARMASLALRAHVCVCARRGLSRECARLHAPALRLHSCLHGALPGPVAPMMCSPRGSVTCHCELIECTHAAQGWRTRPALPPFRLWPPGRPAHAHVQCEVVEASVRAGANALAGGPDCRPSSQARLGQRMI